MAATRVRIKVPKTARKGEIVQVKTLISHDMGSGHRKDKQGDKIPRMIINKFTCTYNGATVIDSDWHTAIASNPYFAFFLRARESGDVVFKWVDDTGKTVEKTAAIKVT